ncbi:MAG: N-glycosylase/DNA lyase [Thermotogaceae bacterium]|nr:N-glycosylase/DNA lyase [Thermotogaceae bacterium]
MGISEALEEVFKVYESAKPAIKKRLSEFKKLYRTASEDDLFAEMAFCLLTPQSRARVCWRAVEKMRDSGVLYSGSAEDIEPYLRGVRFYRTKAKRIVKARKKFYGKIRKTIESFKDIKKLRDFLVESVEGYGYKEASHFLRNIGFGSKLAILDRHILKNLQKLGVIDNIPKSMTKKRYLEIEKKMEDFCQKEGIPMDHLDLVLWYKETGEVFK